MPSAANTGFTLIEAMITVAVLAILASVALPSYNNYLTRGRIPEATTALSTARVKLEQFYQDNRDYGSTSTSCEEPVPAATGNFSFSCAHGASTSDQSFLLTATGTGPMQGFIYTLNQDNQRRTTAVPAGWGTAPVECWVVRQDGGC